MTVVVRPIRDAEAVVPRNSTPVRFGHLPHRTIRLMSSRRGPLLSRRKESRLSQDSAHAELDGFADAACGLGRNARPWGSPPSTPDGANNLTTPHVKPQRVVAS